MLCRCGRELMSFLSRDPDSCPCCYERDNYCVCSTDGTREMCGRHDKALREASDATSVPADAQPPRTRTYNSWPPDVYPESDGDMSSGGWLHPFAVAWRWFTQGDG